MADILIIDDEQAILQALEIFLHRKGHYTYIASTGAKGLTLFSQHCPNIVILDIRLPDQDGLEILHHIRQLNCLTKVIMITAFQDMETTIQAMKDGAFDYIHKPLDIKKIGKTIDQALEVLKIEQKISPNPPLQEPEDLNVIIGKSEKIGDMFKKIGMLCQNRLPVLIQGETGSGKELVARMIHKNSPYKGEPFVIMDCSAVVETLLESDLFGYEKGAFTGAQRTSEGKIKAAGAGTLFLDEIGELPLSLQGKFLGFLQRQEYMRVGGHQMLKAQCRIIAATNRNLTEMVQQGTFKKDLYYRLKVATLEVPPLRERLSDLPLLVEYFLQKIHVKFGTKMFTLQDGVLERLLEHPWYGNVRELENTLAEAAVRAKGHVILQEDIDSILITQDDHQVNPSFSLTPQQILEKHRLEKILEDVRWNRSEAARRLGISRPTLRTRIRQYGIKKKQ